MELAGKVALVTGASSGIGAATARALVGRGARLGLLARRADRLEDLASRLGQDGGRVLPLVADVTNRAQVDDAVARMAAEFGGIDVLVNSAGIGAFGPVESLAADELQRVFDVNVFGTLNSIQASLPALKASGGTVVNVSSFLQDRALPYLGALSASKGAVGALTEAMRMELSPYGVHVLLFGPPQTKTEFGGRGAGSEGGGRRAQADPDDVAADLVRAIERGRRAVVKGRFFQVANLFAPELLDKLFVKSMVARLHRPS